jgi:hypothetical protein
MLKIRKFNCLDALQSAGISYEDATALRRISMTLHRWHEMECGDSNQFASWTVVRGSKQPEGFIYDDDGKPFKEIHWNTRPTQYVPMPDLERGALKRLAKIMARYSGFVSYVQGDPRGCALYILRPGDLNTLAGGNGDAIESCYTRGIAVYK